MFRRIVTGIALVLTALLSGCVTQLGTEVIRAGRPAYNDAILATADELLLQNIVRLRFVDSLGFLTVSSVTASVSLSTTGTVNLGFGPTGNYQGNLVPFAGSLTSEQNPTISYTPVTGDRVMRQLMGEIPVDLVILLLNGAPDHKAVWYALMRRVNNIRNPDFLEPPILAPDRRFEQITELASELQRRGILYWVRLPSTQPGHAMVLHSYSPASSREVTQLLELLGIAKPAREGGDVVVAIQRAVGSPEPGTIAIETRSMFDLMHLAAASVELPADIAAWARNYPQRGPAGKDIRILSASSRPAQARVAVEYRGRWYYIEDTDQPTKQWFLMLHLLASAQVPDTGAGVGPVLTLPAGKR